jgi:two-component system, sensor histidine kinase and response regulator
LRQNGKTVYVVGHPIPDGGFVTTYTDVTAARQAQAAMIEAKEFALQAARLKSDFLANMSHEIRTPMNGVIGLSELLLDTNIDRAQQELLTTMRRSTDTLMTIINDVLDFSKIDAGQLDLETVPFNLRGVVEDVVGLHADTAQRKKIALHCLIDSDLPNSVGGDPTRLTQILSNLLSNALKFTSEGEIVLRVVADIGDGAATAQVRFSVRDTGIGIPTDVQARLFSPFSQADGSTTRKFGGTGLGLSISQKLVALMGGQIEIDSGEGVGSTFHFTVELDVEESHKTSRKYAELSASNVLMVNDSDTNLHVLDHYLTSMKHAACRP